MRLAGSSACRNLSGRMRGEPVTAHIGPPLCVAKTNRHGICAAPIGRFCCAGTSWCAVSFPGKFVLSFVALLAVAAGVVLIAVGIGKGLAEGDRLTAARITAVASRDVELRAFSCLGKPCVAPFKACSSSERGGDHEKNYDDQPLRRSVALVGIHPEDRFDPVIPEKSDDGEDAGDRAQDGL